MKRLTLMLLWGATVLLVLSSAAPAVAAGDSIYKTGFQAWRAADNAFTGWTLDAVKLAADGSLTLDTASALTGTDPYPAGGYYGGNYYNGGSYLIGEATSPVMSAFEFQEAIASWDATTPAGSWIEVQLQAWKGNYYTKWYSMGIWASGTETVQRHSVKLQGDGDGYVATDTLVLAKSKALVTGYQVKVLLFSAGGSAVPSIQNLSVAYSNTAPKKLTTKNTTPITRTPVTLAVPECSQMVYPDGGNVWCSPTSVSMVLGYWGFMPGPCEPRVRATVKGVYDWIYDGHGNWPFNTAFAASSEVLDGALEGYVVRYDSIAKLEPWIDAGIPVVMSIAWGKGDLTGAPIPSSSGHLVVLVGFDGSGNPVVNDPAASANEDVQRTYLRGELESAWLTNSGGTVYLIYPTGHANPGFNQ